ncbi:MAG: class I SAM-dependent methyltransferase [Flavobacterium sp.]
MDKNKIAVSIFDKLATDYQNKFMDVNSYGSTFDVFCNNIPNENATVFEIACGPGNITQHLLQKRPDLKISGIDLSPNMVSLAKINNPTAHFEVMDCRDISSITQKFDAMMCGFCLPYLSKEEMTQLIKDASHLLHPEGVLYLSTMEDDYSQSQFKKGSSGDEIFMHYYREEDLTSVLDDNNFEIIHLQRQDYPANDDTDLIIIAKNSM